MTFAMTLDLVVVLHLVLGEKTLSDKNIMNVNINE
jgi:hypothetical protein